MSHTIDDYLNDIDKLVSNGEHLYNAILFECKPDEMRSAYSSKDEFDKVVKSLPIFREEYQWWYSEAKVIVKYLLPVRLEDFSKHYESPKTRKYIEYENYCIEDFLHGLKVSHPDDFMQKDMVAVIPKFQQQLAIIKGLRNRFESSLYDIRLHLQAEMFDDELDAAMYLLKNRFLRAAGAMAGVVLERHLKQVCIAHEVKLPMKRHLTISDLNETLKQENIIDTADWRRIQLLGDIRNKCDHDKDVQPSKSEVDELIDGVKKITQTLF